MGADTQSRMVILAKWVCGPVKRGRDDPPSPASLPPPRYRSSISPDMVQVQVQDSPPPASGDFRVSLADLLGVRDIARMPRQRAPVPVVSKPVPWIVVMEGYGGLSTFLAGTKRVSCQVSSADLSLKEWRETADNIDSIPRLVALIARTVRAFQRRKFASYDPNVWASEKIRSDTRTYLFRAVTSMFHGGPGEVVTGHLTGFKDRYTVVLENVPSAPAIVHDGGLPIKGLKVKFTYLYSMAWEVSVSIIRDPPS